MTVKEAKKIAESFDENRNPSDEDIFMFTEAMNYLIEENHDPRDMMYLGGYYYEIKHFDLALKYYEIRQKAWYIQSRYPEKSCRRADQKGQVYFNIMH